MAFCPLIGVNGNRCPQVVFSQPERFEFTRQHADNRKALLVKAQRLPDDLRITAKAFLPEGVTEHDNLVTPRLILFVQKGTPQREVHPQHTKQPRRSDSAAHQRRAIGLLQRKPPIAPSAERRRMALTKLKMAVLAPIPNASVSTASSVKLGCLRNKRAPKRRSCHRSAIIVALRLVPGRSGSSRCGRSTRRHSLVSHS